MAIDGISSIGGINQPEDRKVGSDKRVDSETQSDTSAGSSDSVELSGGGTARLNSLLDSIPDVRSEKIEELRNQISNGTYNVDPEDLADSVLEELF